MNYKSFESFIDQYLKAANGLPAPFIIGESGIGKTEIIAAVCKKNQFSLVEVQIGTKTLEYFMGLPEIVTREVPGEEGNKKEMLHETLWTSPDMVTQAKKHVKSVVFIDDFHLAREE